MPETPLELYRKAYRLHYRENKPDDAARLYQSLIEDFPESHVAGYSAIQLEKIRVEEHGRHPRQKSAALNGTAVVLLIVVILGMIGVAVYFMFEIDALQSRIERSQALSTAIGGLATGQHAEAIRTLERLKNEKPSDPTPYILIAGVHKGRQQFDSARSELESFLRIVPGDPAATAQIARIDQAEQVHLRAVGFSVKEEQEAKEEPEKKQPERKPAPKAKPGNRQVKPKLLVDPDSLTFF